MKQQKLSPADRFEVPVILRDCAGLMNPAAISGVEFMFGPVRKRYPQDVSYDARTGVFRVPFSAQQAAQLSGRVPAQARIVFADGSVKATDISMWNMPECMCAQNLSAEVPFSTDGCSGVEKNAKRLAQGDSYELPVIVTRGGVPVTPEDCEELEFVFGSLRKRYPQQVRYDAQAGTYIVPLSQQETFAFGREITCFAVLHPQGEDAARSCEQTIRVERSISKEVL